MSVEYGIFGDESADYSSEEAIEAGFYSKEDAEKALADNYSPEDDLVVHIVEEPEMEDLDEVDIGAEEDE